MKCPTLSKTGRIVVRPLAGRIDRVTMATLI
jgi:hypothetical protein